MSALPSGVAVPIRALLLGSHVLTLAIPLAVVLGTGAWSHDLLHQRQEELSRQAALVAMMVEGEWRSAHSLPDADDAPWTLEGEEGGPPGGTHAVGITPSDVGTDGPDPVLARLAPAMTPSLARVFHATHAGVRVIDTAGLVIATSGPGLGESFADRSEVVAALAGGSSVAVRTELPPALNEPRTDARKTEPLTWAAATAPIAPEGKVVGVVLLTRPTRGVTDALRDMRHDLGRGALLALGVTVTLALGFGWTISRSLRALASVAGEMADGDWWTRPPGEADVRASLGRLAATRVGEVRALTGAFARLAERLEARLRYNEELAGNVSHEFKTPLSTLRGTVDLLLDDDAMPADQRTRFLENARTDLDRLDRMVSGLLQLARAEGAGPREDVPLDEVLDAVAARYPDVEVTRGGGVVSADPAQLELAIGNLVENALVHGARPVTVRGWRSGGRTGVDVVDAGAGVSPANLPRIFDRFFTTSADRRGTGLGLPLVRAVARAHGGDVGVTSAPGLTRFTLWLPERGAFPGDR